MGQGGSGASTVRGLLRFLQLVLLSPSVLVSICCLKFTHLFKDWAHCGHCLEDSKCSFFWADNEQPGGSTSVTRQMAGPVTGASGVMDGLSLWERHQGINQQLSKQKSSNSLVPPFSSQRSKRSQDVSVHASDDRCYWNGRWNGHVTNGPYAQEWERYCKAPYPSLIQKDRVRLKADKTPPSKAASPTSKRQATQNFHRVTLSVFPVEIPRYATTVLWGAIGEIGLRKAIYGSRDASWEARDGRWIVPFGGCPCLGGENYKPSRLLLVGC